MVSLFSSRWILLSGATSAEAQDPTDDSSLMTAATTTTSPAPDPNPFQAQLPEGSPPIPALWPPEIHRALGPQIGTLLSRLTESCLLSYEAAAALLHSLPPPATCPPPPYCPLEGSSELWLFWLATTIALWLMTLFMVGSLSASWTRYRLMRRHSAMDWSVTPSVGSGSARETAC